MDGKELQDTVESDAVQDRRPQQETEMETEPCPQPGTQPSVQKLGLSYTSVSGGQYDIIINGPSPNIQIGEGNHMYINDAAASADYHDDGPLNTIVPKLKIINSKEVPDGRALDIVARKLGKSWRKFGRKLGLEQGELDNVELDYHYEGQYEVTYQMLRKWKEQGYPVELGRLADMLVKIGRGDISDALSKEFLDK